MPCFDAARSPGTTYRPREILVMNKEYWRRYAQLLVRRGVGLRPGQPLYVYGQVAHRRLMALLTEVAYQAGGGRVETRLFDPLQQAALVRHGRLEDIELCHARDQAWLHELLRHGGAFICLVGAEQPGLWDDLARSHPDRHGAYLRGLSATTGDFYRYGIERRWCPWLTAACPTPGWAREVFPELPEDEARDRLAGLLFHFTGADREDALELAARQDRLLKARCRELDSLEITEIHVTGGGSDLRVRLSSQARWQGGSQTTAGGQVFFYNLPAEEVFTAPDRRATEGRLAITRPFRFPGGPLVRDLVLQFRDGRVVDFAASSGSSAFGRLLEADDGARHLGELAFADEGSALARSGIFFNNTQLDENASSHVALGQAFLNGIAGGEAMSSRELEGLGVNHSMIHTDVMFGSASVQVVATESREGELVLISRGRWAERFDLRLQPSRLSRRGTSTCIS